VAKEIPVLKVNPPIQSELENKFFKMDFVASLSLLGVNILVCETRELVCEMELRVYLPYVLI